MRLEHWKHFLALENDLNTIARYVEPTEANFGTFSVELTKLFLNACSEVEAVCKLLCAEQSPTTPAKNMDQYRSILHVSFPKFHTIEVLVPKYDLTFTPWALWSGGANPDRWQEHQDVKHSRHQYFSRASLLNALQAMGGLFSLLLYYYRQQENAGHLVRFDAFFELQEGPQVLLGRGTYLLPDFP